VNRERTAVELVDVDGVARALRRFGEHYLREVFTEHEIACCGRGNGPTSALQLAARFAAKEATLKLLGPTSGRPGWRSVEVVRLPTGACRLRLHGAAARLALERGLGPFNVSLTTEAGMAAAVVTCGSAPGPEQPRTMRSSEY
jgi:holo-[acyl-carrier protein] synthase